MWGMIEAATPKTHFQDENSRWEKIRECFIDFSPFNDDFSSPLFFLKQFFSSLFAACGKTKERFLFLPYLMLFLPFFGGRFGGGFSTHTQSTSELQIP